MAKEQYPNPEQEFQPRPGDVKLPGGFWATGDTAWTITGGDSNCSMGLSFIEE